MKQLIPFGIAARPVIGLDDAKNNTYRKNNGEFPPTPLIFPDNPYNNVVKNAKNILEIGCGCGRNVPWIMENTNANYVGIDPNESMRREFHRNLDIKIQTQWNGRVSVADSTQKVDGDFDVIISTFVLQHIGFRTPEGVMNVADICNELKEMLRTGGIFILFEHEEEEKWIDRWKHETGINPQVFIRNYGGFTELNDRGQVHHLMIWQKT